MNKTTLKIITPEYYTVELISDRETYTLNGDDEFRANPNGNMYKEPDDAIEEAGRFGDRACPTPHWNHLDRTIQVVGHWMDDDGFGQQVVIKRLYAGPEF